MGWFKNISLAFWKHNKKNVEEPEEEEWDHLIYARDDIDFNDHAQGMQYVENCLEQMEEAAKELNTLTGEYNLVTSYLTDMEEIEALPDEEREEVNRLAGKLAGLDREIVGYREKKDRMSEADYHRIRSQESEIESGIKKLKENEKYASLIKKDLRRLDGERHAYAYRKAELNTMLANFRGMAVIFLSAFVFCILLLLLLQFGFKLDTAVGYFISTGALAIALTVICVKFMDADRELSRVEKTINKLIQLQNKVKIRYVNNAQLLEYQYMKYNTDSAANLEKLWALYQDEKEERKQYAEAEAKTEYYRQQLITQLSKYRVKDPGRWVHQTAALLDQREMVEIRHKLILRRQSLRKQMEYNSQVEETAKKEIRYVADTHPSYRQEILKRTGDI